MTFPAEIDAFIKALEATKARFSDGRLDKAFEILRAAVSHYPIMICGNGGSAADAQHIAAELVGRFLSKHREPINAISLAADSSVLTAWANDVGYDAVFARQVKAHGWRGQRCADLHLDEQGFRIGDPRGAYCEQCLRSQ